MREERERERKSERKKGDKEKWVREILIDKQIFIYIIMHK